MHLPIRPIVATFSLATLLAGSVTADQRERFEDSVPLSRGGSFSIENKNGSISIKTWDQDTVRIEAEKRARRESDLADIEIDIQGSGDSVSVETHLPRSRFWGNGGSVNYVITVPREANVSVSTANGSLEIDGVHGRVEASSVNGRVEIEDIAGTMDVSTTNGSIRAGYARAESGSHRFKTTNGSVRVYLPNDAGGDFEARTVNGSIEVDFPTSLTRSGRRHLRGSFGSGNGSYEFRTVNGSVKVLSQ